MQCPQASHLPATRTRGASPHHTSTLCKLFTKLHLYQVSYRTLTLKEKLKLYFHSLATFILLFLHPYSGHPSCHLLIRNTKLLHPTHSTSPPHLTQAIHRPTTTYHNIFPTTAQSLTKTSPSSIYIHQPPFHPHQQLPHHHHLHLHHNTPRHRHHHCCFQILQWIVGQTLV